MTLAEPCIFSLMAVVASSRCFTLQPALLKTFLIHPDRRKDTGLLLTRTVVLFL